MFSVYRVFFGVACFFLRLCHSLEAKTKALHQCYKIVIFEGKKQMLNLGPIVAVVSWLLFDVLPGTL